MNDKDLRRVGKAERELFKKLCKEERKAKLRITMYERYGIVPKKYDLRDDIVRFGLDKSKYPELFEKKEMEK